jgi:hypothetical protein
VKCFENGEKILSSGSGISDHDDVTGMADKLTLGPRPKHCTALSIIQVRNISAIHAINSRVNYT